MSDRPDTNEGSAGARREHVIAFLDTNYFLHFKDPTQIDWCEFVNARKVTLRVAHAVVEELDNKKDLSSDPKVRDRAQKRLLWIERALDDSRVRAGVDASVEQEAPSLDLEKEGLNPSRPDHHLLCAVLVRMRDAAQAQVVLVSNDSSLRMTARGRGIEVIRPLPGDRLPTSDERDKEIQRLRDRIAQHEDRAPTLSLCWKNETDQMEVALPGDSPVDDEEIRRRMETLRAEYPRMPLPPEQSSPPDGRVRLRSEGEMLAAGAMNFGEMFGPSAEQVRKYNEELDRFFVRYEKHLRDESEYRSLLDRLLPVTVILSNDGRGPATRVHIEITLPEGVGAFHPADLSKETPSPPTPPARPRSRLDGLGGGLPHGGGFDPLSTASLSRSWDMPDLADMIDTRPPNVDGPFIDKLPGGAAEVRFEVSHAKHRFSYPLDEFVLFFQPPELPRSVHLDYSLHPTELPEPVTGKLHIRVSVGSDKGAQ